MKPCPDACLNVCIVFTLLRIPRPLKYLHRLCVRARGAAVVTWLILLAHTTQPLSSFSVPMSQEWNDKVLHLWHANLLKCLSPWAPFPPCSLAVMFTGSYVLTSLCYLLWAQGQSVLHSHSWELILIITSTDTSCTHLHGEKCHLSSFLTCLFCFVIVSDSSVPLPSADYSTVSTFKKKKLGWEVRSISLTLLSSIWLTGFVMTEAPLALKSHLLSLRSFLFKRINCLFTTLLSELWMQM